MSSLCRVARSPSKIEERSERQKKRLFVQRRSMNQTELALAPPIVHEVLRSPGHQLDSETCTFMESQFGHDFSRVKVHTDVKAAESAKSINARAYTAGQHLIFGAREYNPKTLFGKKLLAHELTHTLQQSTTRITPWDKHVIAAPNHYLENEAEALASQTVKSYESFSNYAHDNIETRTLPNPRSYFRKSLKPIIRTDASALLIQRALLQRTSAPVDKAKLVRFRSLITQYRSILKSNLLSSEEIAEVNEAIRKAETAIRNAETLAGKGSTLTGLAGGALAVSGGMVVDDLTVIGVADDVVLPFVLIAAGVLALGGLIASSSAHDISRSSKAANEAVGQAIKIIGQILLAQQVGRKVRGLTDNIIIHLARILGTAVCGRPPDHQKDPNRNRPHWWKEIKETLKQIRDKGLSPKQLLRELRKKFTKEQLTEIRNALRRVAEMMKQDPPDFPPIAQ